jgi:hypothetical protein
MNTLWVSVIALVFIAVAIVVVFNLVQSRQQRARLRGIERPAEADPAGGGPSPAAGHHAPDLADDGDTDPHDLPTLAREDRAGRVEPTFGSGPLPHPQDADDPGFTGAGGTVSLSPVALSTGSADPNDDADMDDRDIAPPTLDPRLDAIVELEPAGPVAGDRLVTVAGTARRAGSKPLTVEADAGDGRWRSPRSGRTYVRVRVGVLLANRTGALNAMEFSEFTTAVQALARHIGAQPALPEMQPLLEHARALDDACMDLDAQIGLNIETPGALSPAELASLAHHLELVERGNNRFARLGEAGEVLFSLALGERANLLTLLLDVPRAPERQQPWPQMLDCARECAAATAGRLVDDADRPLTEPAAGAVLRQLAMRYRSLEEAGLAAGSPAALRVFN